MISTGAAVPLALSGYSVAIEPRLAPRLVSYSISPADWTSEQVLRIGILADLHACDPWACSP